MNKFHEFDPWQVLETLHVSMIQLQTRAAQDQAVIDLLIQQQNLINEQIVLLRRDLLALVLNNQKDPK
jgi:hypothetical protein